MTTNLLSVIEQQHKALSARMPGVDTGTQAKWAEWHDMRGRALAAAQQALEQARGEAEYFGLEPWERPANVPVATMIFPKHSPTKPFVALGDCAKLYPDAAQCKPLYTHPQASEPLSHAKTESTAGIEGAAITRENGKSSEPAPSTEKDRRPTLTVDYSSDAEDIREYCGFCGGDGDLRDGTPCPFCDGSGRVNEPAPSTAGERADAERLADRLDSSDPDFDDCSNAAIKLRHLHALTKNLAIELDAPAFSHALALGVIRRAAALLQSTALPVGELTPNEDQIHEGVKALLQCAWSDVETLSPMMYTTYMNDVRRVYVAMAATRSQPTTEESSVVAGAPPAREPLTDEQIMALQKERMLYQDGVTPSGLKRITRAIEAKHGITKKGE